MLLIVAVGCAIYAPPLGYIKCKSKLSVPFRLNALSVSITVVVEAFAVDILPENCTSLSSASCTRITSPATKAPPLIPVLNVTISFSNFSVSKCHLPSLCA